MVVPLTMHFLQLRINLRKHPEVIISQSRPALHPWTQGMRSFFLEAHRGLLDLGESGTLDRASLQFLKADVGSDR